MNNNQILIKYDPYKKKIQYQYRKFSDNQWVDLAPEATLNREKYETGTLQNLAEEIVVALRDDYCTDGSGVDLFFSGTDLDWADLKETVKRHDPDGRITCCEQLEKLNAPDEALPKIQCIFEDLSAQLESLQDSKVREPIDHPITICQDVSTFFEFLRQCA